MVCPMVCAKVRLYVASADADGDWIATFMMSGHADVLINVVISIQNHIYFDTVKIKETYSPRQELFFRLKQGAKILN